jgi:hypothetical protein
MMHYDVLAASRDEVPETRMTKIGPENCMISIIQSISWIHSWFALTKGPGDPIEAEHLKVDH